MLLRLRTYFSNENVIIVLTLFVYFITLFFTIFHHELWHEEMQGWLIARSANSISTLYSNLRYEAHPMLWYLLLFIVSRFTSDPLWMQLLSGLIGCLVAFIFLKYAPFRLYQRVLFVFGYFPLYEYVVLSRNYLLTVLFLFSYCIFFVRNKYWMAAFSLLLIMQTSIPGLILGTLLGLHLTICFKKKQLYLGLLLILSIALSLFQIIPPHDYGITVDWITSFDYRRFLMVLIMLWRGYFPIPRLSLSFWNTNILIPDFAGNTFLFTPTAVLGLSFALTFSLLLLIGIGCYFFHRRKVMILFYAGTLSLLSFFYFFYYGAVRHWGFLYLFFICCVWISYQQTTRYRLYFFTLLLCAQLYSGLFAIFLDINYTFAAGKAAALYVTENKLQNTVLIGDIDTHVVSVAGYVNSSFYYPREKVKSSFAVVRKNRETVREDALFLFGPSTLILSYPLLYPHCEIIFQKSFIAQIAQADSYYVYTVNDSKCRKL